MDENIVTCWVLPSGINVQPELVMLDLGEASVMLFGALGAEPDADLAVMAAEVAPAGGGDGLRMIGFLTAADQEEDNFEGPKSLNILASVLFDVDEPVCGPCVVAVSESGTNAFTDMPRWLLDASDTLVAKSAKLWNTMVDKAQALAFALENDLLDGDEVIETIANEDAERMNELVETAENAIEMLGEHPSVDDAVQALINELTEGE